jgi:hypothetical protein
MVRDCTTTQKNPWFAPPKEGVAKPWGTRNHLWHPSAEGSRAVGDGAHIQIPKMKPICEIPREISQILLDSSLNEGSKFRKNAPAKLLKMKGRKFFKNHVDRGLEVK